MFLKGGKAAAEGIQASMLQFRWRGTAFRKGTVETRTIGNCS